MNVNDDLFGQTPYGNQPPHRSGSETSRQAAEAQLPHLGRLQRAYYEALYKAGRAGLTDHDAARILGRPLSSINARRNELRLLGLVKDSGRTRLSPHKIGATVWVTT